MSSLDTTPARALAVNFRFGWWALLCSLTLGIALETLHGFKIDWYLGVASETRRLLWRLAHVHGTLIALVNIAVAVSESRLTFSAKQGTRLPSRMFILAGTLMPLGFFAGGVHVHKGDPNLAILLVPVGAFCLFVAVALTAAAASRAR